MEIVINENTENAIKYKIDHFSEIINFVEKTKELHLIKHFTPSETNAENYYEEILNDTFFINTITIYCNNQLLGFYDKYHYPINYIVTISNDINSIAKIGKIILQ